MIDTSANHKKIEIICESIILNAVLDLLQRHGARGYTVLQAIAGDGNTGRWTAHEISGSSDHVVVIAVTKPETATQVLREAAALFGDYMGIVYSHDVEVVRAEHF